MQKKCMSSQKGLTLVKLVLIVIILMLLTGISTYVALIGNQNNPSEPITKSSGEISTNEVQEDIAR